MSYEEFAKREFLLAGYTPLDQDQEEGPNKWMQENVLELLKIFSEQGHSGFSAPYCVEIFSKLALHKPLTPLTGEDDEWNDVSEMCGRPTWQNKRCSHVFKESDDARAYDMNGIVWMDKDGCSYTNHNSRVEITFPYTPKTEYLPEPVEENVH